MRSLLCGIAVLATNVALAGPLVELSAESSKSVANDLFRATVYVEHTGEAPKDAAKKANESVRDALQVAHGYSKVKSRTSGAMSYPIYGKSRKIEGWRMRSEVALESQDAATLSELLGRLQQTMATGSYNATVSAETFKATESATTVEAIGEFKARAQNVANALGATYSLKELHVTANRAGHPVPVARMMNMAVAETTPMPIEAGDTTITVTISGKIELTLPTP